MAQPEEPNMVPANFEMQIPLELEVGAYADFLGIWHSPHGFTLDFAVTQPPVAQDSDDPNSPVTVPCRVTSRVKIPSSLVFDVMRALNENMTAYEQAYGEIKRPGQEKGEGSQ